MKIIENSSRKQVFNFLATGAATTVGTLALYAALNLVLSYQLAYFISYIFGIMSSYILNVLFVFKTGVSLRTFLRFPLVPLMQYACGAVLLELLVEKVGIPTILAPLFIIVLTLPLTFYLSRFVLRNK